MITDMHVAARRNRILLDVPLTLAAALRDKLDGLIFSEDAQVTDESARLVGVDRDSARRLRDRDRRNACRTSSPGLAEINLDTFEVIRIERGVPRFLADMSEDTIPLEAGIEDRAISFTKGCYVGQEVIVRVTHRGGGRVAKKLVRWIADPSADIVPLPESRISFDPRFVRQGHRPRHQRRLLPERQSRRRPRLRASRFHGKWHGRHGDVE